MSTAPTTSNTTVNYEIRLTPSRMTIVTAALLSALIGCSIPSNMLIPLLTSPEASYRIGPVAAIWISLIALLSGAAFAAVYLVTSWPGFRGDRAMVRRPAIEGAVPAGVSE